MRSDPAIRGVYAILDTGVSAGEDLVRFAEDYLRGGVRIIQLRDKGGSPARRDIAAGIAALKKDFDFLFVVNDDLELARRVGADGVHVGKGDPSVEECKKVVACRGEVTSPLRVGYSAHSLDEAIEAERRGADYVAFGAIFPTPTKGPGHPVQGLEKLREVVRSLKVPVVAIGGIARGNVKDVLATGVHSVAMISALAKAGDRVEEARYFSGLFA
jgi:thiamine-phosphate pyrophosphorylase